MGVGLPLDLIGVTSAIKGTALQGMADLAAMNHIVRDLVRDGETPPAQIGATIDGVA